MSVREQSKTANGINVLAGIWLIISPYILGFAGTAAATNAIIIGIIVGILALIEISSPENTGWMSWVNIILGVWLILSAFVIGMVSAAAIWNSVILGIIVIALSAWSSSASSRLKMT